MEKLLCNVKLTATLFLAIAASTAALSKPSGSYHATAADDLSDAPALTRPSISNQQPSQFYCESTIELNYNNPNEGTQTEIYRSINEDTGYARIAVTGSGVGLYTDAGVHSNIVYYYKVRAVSEGATSDFSEVWHLRSPSDFYNPELTAQNTTAGVEVKLFDKSYADLHYYLRRYETGTDNWMDLPVTITMPDSGNVYTYVDQSVMPNTAYRYYVDAIQDCDGHATHYEIAFADVETTELPEVYDFTLVYPETDVDIGGIDSWMELGEDQHLNFRANTNAATKSVAFYLNGERYWGENQEPFALFGDRQGDYNRGRLRPGTYLLEAVPYSEKLQRGIAGRAKSVYFVIVDSNGDATARSAAEVNVFPNPVVEKATIEINGEPNARVSVAIMDAQGNALRHEEQLLDGTGWMSEDWNVDGLKKGTYYLSIAVGNETLSRRIIKK